MECVCVLLVTVLESEERKGEWGVARVRNRGSASDRGVCQRLVIGVRGRFVGVFSGLGKVTVFVPASCGVYRALEYLPTTQKLADAINSSIQGNERENQVPRGARLSFG
ncbi:unnamed protein product [Dovyalis caffra]|uniref:Uncharacterized protein n=1 Tax=Dovyalis caffra TaxID=77055 RepID=A0AAV1RPM7_9ROSI|nr:unnamed protein product [Dovyalis caffra]